MSATLGQKAKRWAHALLHRAGLDVVRYRRRPEWPEDRQRYRYQQKFVRFDIPPGSVVLDIGSGAYPFPPATILADRYPVASPHRTEDLARDRRPFLVLDIHHLPFPDKSIDFLYCSHVLEHVADPGQACRELMRTARRGYIETPTYASDVLFSWADRVGHRWHVVAINQCLHFFEYTPRQQKGIQSTVWQDLIRGPVYHPLQEAFYRNPDLFQVMFSWEDRFEYRVERLTC